MTKHINPLIVGAASLVAPLLAIYCLSLVSPPFPHVNTVTSVLIFAIAFVSLLAMVVPSIVLQYTQIRLNLKAGQKTKGQYQLLAVVSFFVMWAQSHALVGAYHGIAFRALEFTPPIFTALMCLNGAMFYAANYPPFCDQCARYFRALGTRAFAFEQWEDCEQFYFKIASPGIQYADLVAALAENRPYKYGMFTTGQASATLCQCQSCGRVVLSATANHEDGSVRYGPTYATSFVLGETDIPASKSIKKLAAPTA